MYWTVCTILYVLYSVYTCTPYIPYSTPRARLPSAATTQSILRLRTASHTASLPMCHPSPINWPRSHAPAVICRHVRSQIGNPRTQQHHSLDAQESPAGGVAKACSRLCCAGCPRARRVGVQQVSLETPMRCEHVCRQQTRARFVIQLPRLGLEQDGGGGGRDCAIYERGGWWSGGRADEGGLIAACASSPADLVGELITRRYHSGVFLEDA